MRTILAPPLPKPLVRIHYTERLTDTCSITRQDCGTDYETFIVALNGQGNDAARVTRADAWKLLAALEAWMDRVGAPR